MAFVLCFFTLFAVCACESYWQLQLSPESIAAVAYGNSHITVWEHATWKGKFYTMPIVCLQSETAEVVQNIFTGRTELEFDVLLWSREARETVYHFLKTHINASVVEEQVELLPMEKIRVVWKGPPLPDYYQLSDQWRSNTHLPTVVTFSVRCQNNEKCEELQNAIRAQPSVFKEMEMEYLNSERSVRRRLTVKGRHLVSGSQYALLQSMTVSSPVRYVRSQDIKRLVIETLTNLISSQVTDEEYVDKDDEISMSDLLQRVFEQSKVSTADFQPMMWQSVYWNPDNARPDKITSYLNKVVSRNETNSSHLTVNQSQRSTVAEMDFNILGLFDDDDSSSRPSVLKENLLQVLRDKGVATEWTGEHFIPNPLQLFRLNLATLNTSTNILTSYVQIRRHDTVQSIKLKVNCDTNQTSRLTPELVQARIETFVQKTETEQNKLADVLQTGLNKLEAALETQSSRLGAALETQGSRLGAALETQGSRQDNKSSEAAQNAMVGLKALEMIISANGGLIARGYCYRPGYFCHHFPSSVRHAALSRQRLKTQCNQHSSCKAFNDYTRSDHRGGRILREICPPDQFTPDTNDRYYVKISEVKITDRKLSEIAQSALDRNNSIFDLVYCRQLGEDYHYEE